MAALANQGDTAPSPSNTAAATTTTTTTRPSERSSPQSPFSVQRFPEADFSSAKLAVLVPPIPTDTAAEIPSRPSAVNKSVRFSPKAYVRVTISRHDMSPDEQKDYWLQGHEFRGMKLRNRNGLTHTTGEVENRNESNSTQRSHRTTNPLERETEASKSASPDPDLCIPGLESGRSAETTKARGDLLYSSIYYCDAINDPFDDVFDGIQFNC